MKKLHLHADIDLKMNKGNTHKIFFGYNLSINEIHIYVFLININLLCLVAAIYEGFIIIIHNYQYRSVNYKN